MKDLFTIIYYTSNREDESFENKIRNKLLEVSGKIPIISVSQKPIGFGTNICVGDVGACDANLFRQIEIGCKVAQTPFVISAEADCLYPPEYFKFIPKKKNEYYRFDNLFILSQWGEGDYGGFYRKDTAPFAQISDRLLYLKMLKKALNGLPYWHDATKKTHIRIFLDKPWQNIHNVNPVLDLKTYNGMRRHTQTFGSAVAKLPYWGSADAVRKEIWG